MHDHGNYDERWQRGWRKFERMAQRWGRGAPFGPRGWEGFGENFRIGRMLASGDLRLVALYLIEQQPRHGYDLIKAIEDKSQGFYSPSPGVIYPALTFLEEAGYVSSAPDGNKKLYTITDDGRAHLADNRNAIQATLDFLEKAGAEINKWREVAREGWQDRESEDSEHPMHRGPGFGGRHGPHHRHGPGPGADRDTPNVVPEFNEARRDLKAAIADAIALGEDEQRRVADILRRAANDIRGAKPEHEVDI
jgi:DNA-binding PadR family transcriptional regulator